MARQTSLKSFADAQASSSSDSSSIRSTSEASNIVMDAPVEDYESESNSGDSDSAFKSPPLHCPVKRKMKVEKRTSKSDWKVKYMMWPVKSSSEEAGTAKADETDMMMCIHCQEKMKAKSSTAKCHLERKHPSSLTFSMEKRERLIRQFEHMYSKQKTTLTTALEPDKLVKLAPYKLVFVLGKHKLPYSCCESFIEFARAADPILHRCSR